MTYKLRKIGILFFILFSVLLAIPFFAYAKEENNIIKVGYFSTNEGKNRGYSVEYLNEISKYTDWEYEYVYGSLEELFEMLKNGEIDILTSIQRTDEREKYYDYTDIACIIESTVIYVNEDYDIYYNDFDSLDGLTYGLLKGSIQNELFKEFAKENNFTYKIKRYEKITELNAALKNKEIDAIVDGSFRKNLNGKIVSKFMATPSYFITKKGNTKILNSLNDAMIKINLNSPNFAGDLFEKYYVESIGTEVVYSKEEAEYIKKNPKIKIAYKSNYRPLEYYNLDEGMYKGISIEIINEISDLLGIEFEVVKTENEKEIISGLYSGDIQLSASEILGNRKFDDEAIKLSNTYLNVPMVVVGTERSINENAHMNIGMIEYNDNIISYINKYYEGAMYTYYDSAEEALNAIISGESDITIANTYQINEIISNENYKNLKIADIDEISTGLRIGVSGKADPVLLSIINKGITQLSKDKITAIILRSTTEDNRKISISEILNKYKLYIIIIILLFLIFYCWVLLRTRISVNNKLEILAYYDTLTGCPNSIKFEIDARRILNEHNDQKYSIIFFDIDDFKMINDMCGRRIGDKILTCFAENLCMKDKSNYAYGRITADHFVALINYKEKNEICNFILSQIHHIQAYNISGLENFHITLSCGVYNISNRELSINTMIDNAMMASRTIKGDHLKFYACYKDEMMDKIKKDAEFVQLMDKALENEEFEVYFQPKYNLIDRKMIGAEALIRWNSSKKGFLLPGAFVPLFERNGFIVNIDFYVLEKIFKMIKSWIDRGMEPIVVSVNQSRKHFDMPDYLERLELLVDKYKIPPNLIEMEITESAFLQDQQHIIDVMGRIKELGFLVSIDDFGSGYSSLNLLRNVPADIIKLDKNFLDESVDSARSKSIIKHVVDMSKDLNMDVICEGVETEQQAEFLREIDCTMGQGFLYAKPMTYEKFEKMLGDSRL